MALRITIRESPHNGRADTDCNYFRHSSASRESAALLNGTVMVAKQLAKGEESVALYRRFAAASDLMAAQKLHSEFMVPIKDATEDLHKWQEYIHDV